MDCGAVGFGVNMDLLCQAVLELGQKDRMAVQYLLWGREDELEPVYRLTERLRAEGCPVEVSLSAVFDEALIYAAGRGIPHVLAWENAQWTQVSVADKSRVLWDKEA